MTQSNIFRVMPQGLSNYPFELAVARGLVPGHSVMQKFGTLKPPTADTVYDLWTGASAGNASYTFSTTATKMKLSSSSTDDAVAGIGTCCVSIAGLDADFNEVSEYLNLDGQTPVETANTYIRVFRAYSLEVGTTEHNVGDIYIYETGETSVIAGVPQTASLLRAKIDATVGQTEMAIYTVPAGKTAYIHEVIISVSNRAARYTDVFITKRDYGNGGFRRLFGSAFESASTVVVHPTIPGPFAAKTDIKMQAITTATATSSIYGRFHLILVDNA